MYIYPKSPGPIRPETASPSSSTDATERSQDIRPLAPATSASLRFDRSDKVEISDAGRALAARDGEESQGLDPARAARIRGRVLSGAYDTLEVVDAVARRLLDSGDL